MAQWREWFEMTRHERRGAIALLVLLVMAVGTLGLMRSRSQPLTAAETEQMRQFELMADSIAQRADSAAKSAGHRGAKGPNPQSPIPNPQSPIPIVYIKYKI